MSSKAREELRSEDLAFLRELDERCHYITRLSGDRYHPRPRKVHDYHDGVVLTVAEVERLVEIVQRCEILVLPTTTKFGFTPAFSVVAPQVQFPDVPPEFQTLLRFAEAQLPPGWKFDKLATECFPDERQTKFYGLRFSRDRVAYVY